MDYESALISSVLINSDISEVIETNLSTEVFVSRVKEWEYITDFYRSHGAPPPMEQFSKLFPDFEVSVPKKTPVSFLIEELRKRRVHNIVAEGMKEMALHLKSKNPIGALDEMRNAVILAEDESRPSRDVNFTENPLARIKQYDKLAAMGGITGYQTPWPCLDEVTLGFHPEELIMIVGRSNVGKTWCEVVLSRYHWTQGLVSLLFTKEMAVNQIIQRIDASNAEVCYQRFRSGQLTQDEYDRWVSSLYAMEGSRPFWVVGDDDGSSGVMGVESKIEKYRPHIAYIDGFAYMSDDAKSPSGWERMHSLCRGLKRIARRKRIPIVVSHWFNAKGGPESGGEGDLKFGDVQNHFDLMIGMYQSEDLRLNKEMKFKILKQREGVKLEWVTNWDLDSMHFEVKSMGEDDIPEDLVDNKEEVRF